MRGLCRQFSACFPQSFAATKIRAASIQNI
jgi:hypothetical protein